MKEIYERIQSVYARLKKFLPKRLRPKEVDIMKIYSVLDVARFVINNCNEKGYEISNLKLQKLLYFIQAAYLSEGGGACFNEDIQAWDFGPVVPDAYFEYRRYGNRSIPEIDEYIPQTQEGNALVSFRLKKYDKNIIGQEDRVRIGKINDMFSEFSATALVKVTHKQEPWCSSYVRGYNRVISKESIKRYFSDNE